MMMDAGSLRQQTDSRLDAPLAAWRRYRESGRTTSPAGLSAEVAELARSVDELFGWSDDVARSVQPTGAAAEPASAGGPAGYYLLAEKAGASAIDFDKALTLAAELALNDDDIVFLLAFAAKSKHADGETAGAMMQLAALTMRNDAVAGKLFRTLAALTSDPNQQLQLYQGAEKRLAGGADDALRAEVWNEMAILLASHGEVDEGTKLARAAHELATNSGASRIASMALGNLAWCLMQQQNFLDALRAFERLEKEQIAAGDMANLDITRQNIAICRRNLLSA